MGWLKKILGAKPTTAQTSEKADALTPTERASQFPELYPGQHPFHFGAGILFEDGGPDPLHGVSIYWNSDGPHWHYISFGLEDRGFELSFRLAATAEDIGQAPEKFLGAIAYNAPTWPIKMLNMLARRVHRLDRPFAHGHWWQGPPGVLQPYTDIEALLFARDPQLNGEGEESDSPIWLQAFAIEPASVEAMKLDELHKRGDAELERLQKDNPLLVSGLL